MNATSLVNHCAVMKQEVLSHLLRPGPAVYVDCTLGGGEHSRALLAASEASSIVIRHRPRPGLHHRRPRLGEAVAPAFADAAWQLP